MLFIFFLNNCYKWFDNCDWKKNYSETTAGKSIQKAKVTTSPCDRWWNMVWNITITFASLEAILDIVAWKMSVDSLTGTRDFSDGIIIVKLA